MIEIGKYYYASTPRSKQQKKQERVKVLSISGNVVTCITVDPLKIEQIYNIYISDVKNDF
jgi:hypothetical protein